MAPAITVNWSYAGSGTSAPSTNTADINPIKPDNSSSVQNFALVSSIPGIGYDATSYRLVDALAVVTCGTSSTFFGTIIGELYTKFIKFKWKTHISYDKRATSNIVCTDVYMIGLLDTGTSTGSNDNTYLNDTTKSWTTDKWAGKVLVITSGIESGQIAKIISNTATQLVVPSMDIIPSTCTYSIVNEAYRCFVGDPFSSIYCDTLCREGV